MEDNPPEIDIEEFLKATVSDHAELSARIKFLNKEIKTKNNNVTVRGHYLAFRQSKPTESELIDLLFLKLVPFCHHRGNLKKKYAEWQGLSNEKIQKVAVEIQQSAIDLFKSAQKNTNRNGEYGELLLYLLIEFFLSAPQILAKMSLKTNSQMPVHGSDGIHVGFRESTGELILYWGESKCHSKISNAISDAIKSVSDTLSYKKLSREIYLIQEYIELSGFPEAVQKMIVDFLNPESESYNKRIDASAVLIAFDFDSYIEHEKENNIEAEEGFKKDLQFALEKQIVVLEQHLETHQIGNHHVDIFFLPVKSVANLRDSFQKRIGWSNGKPD